MSDAYSAISGESYAGLGAKIKLYDTMTKFWTDTYAQLAVPIPFVYRVTNPLCCAAEYLLLYIAVYNFTVNKKINPLHVCSVFLMVVRIVMNGSRSPILRIVTFVVCLLYIFYMRQGRQYRLNGKLLGIMAASAGDTVSSDAGTAFCHGSGDRWFQYFGLYF